MPMTVTKYTPTQFVGAHPAVSEKITLASNGSTAQSLPAGTVLGKITASGKYVALNPSGSDGSQVAARILTYEASVPATGDLASRAYKHGSFVQAGLNFNGADATKTALAIADLEAKGLYIITDPMA